MSNYTKFNAEIQRKIKGTRVLFYCTINGVRISKTNYARKYDARAYLRHVMENLTSEKIQNFLDKKQG